MKSFKNRENVLTRLRMPVIAGCTKGLRIIVRLYPIPTRLKPYKALCINGLRAISACLENRKGKSFSVNGARPYTAKYSLLSSCYKGIALNKMLKLLKVLTCKLSACQVFTCRGNWFKQAQLCMYRVLEAKCMKWLNSGVSML